MSTLLQYAAVVDPPALWGSPKHPGYLTPEGKKQLLSCGIDGVNIRLPISLSGTYWDACVDLIRETTKAGLPWLSHSWEGQEDEGKCADAAEGKKDALRVCATIKALQKATNSVCQRYGCNAESDTWSDRKGGANPTAVEYLDSFATTFYEELTTCFLDYLGYPMPSWHYGKKDANKDGRIDSEIPKDLQERFSKVLVMAYQSSLPDLKGVLDRALKVWGETPMGAFISIGHVTQDRLEDGTRHARVIGNAAAWIQLVKEHYAHLEEIHHYLGIGWQDQVIVGNPKHPPTIEFVKLLQAASQG